MDISDFGRTSVFSSQPSKRGPGTCCSAIRERKLLHLLRHDILRHNMKIQFTSQIFHEGKMYVAYTPELDVSSGATTEAKAQKNLFEAVRLFLEEAEKKVRWIRFSRRRGLFVANRLSLRRGR